MRNNTRATVYFAPEIFKALRLKTAATHRSMSEMVNEAVRDALAEDATDLDAFSLLQDDADASLPAMPTTTSSNLPNRRARKANYGFQNCPS